MAFTACTAEQCLQYSLYSKAVFTVQPVQRSSIYSTACTAEQCLQYSLYSGAVFTVQPVQQARQLTRAKAASPLETGT